LIRVKEAGYATGIVGKWHIGEWEAFNPVHHGFDSFHGFMEYGGDKGSARKTGIYRNTELVEKDVSKTDGIHSPKLLAAGIEFIKANKDKPFFLYYASPLPHTKWIPNERFKGSSKQGTYGNVVHEIDPGIKQKFSRKNMNGLGGQYDWGAIDMTREEMYDGKNATYIAEEIRKDHDEPQFWLLGIFKPHEPWYLPQKYFDMYPLEDIVLPEIGEQANAKLSAYAKKTYIGSGFEKTILPSGQWRRGVQGYLAASTLADDCLGDVLNALEESGKLDNTIILLWSDHGWHLGEKNHWRKTTLWQEVTRNVLSISVPGMTKPGSLCERTAQSIDLYPTLCELAGVPVPNQLEGRSLVPLLKQPSLEWDHPAITIANPGDVNVRTEKWAYIHYHTGDEELYDMTKDEMQWNNLAANPEYRAVKEKLMKHIPEHKANFIGVKK
jgi:arylsulfatase A-like enzyme